MLAHTILSWLLLPGIPPTTDVPGNDVVPQGEPPSMLEELFLSDLIYPQERGELQISTGLWLGFDRGERRTVLPLVLEWGMTDDLQLELLLPYVDDSDWDVSGIDEVGVGALVQIAKDAQGGPQLAVGADVTFLDAHSGEVDWSVEPFALFYRAGEALDLNAGLGLSLSEADGEWDTGALGALAFIKDLGPCTGSFEVLGEQEDGDLALSAAPGLSWRWGDYEFGCAVAVGLTDAAADVQVLFTLTREWSFARPE
ncbi:MAG TPA: hypothetical protein VK843_19105 [Planctomycetota bacterium]|nr:hypothetical protein [Planctomycetota bacterium]